MPSKKVSKPMTDAEHEAWESTRDLEAELIESAHQMAKGKTSVAYAPVIAARKASGLSQTQFAALLGPCREGSKAAGSQQAAKTFIAIA